MEVRTSEFKWVATEPVAGMPTQPPSLTFAWLHDHVQQYVADEPNEKPSRLERWSFWFGFGMAGLGLASPVLSKWFPPNIVGMVAIVCLVAELAGLALSMALMLRRELPKLFRLRKSHAFEMDVTYGKWERVIAELRRFPRAEREARLRFVSALRARMGERMGIAFGGIQRLGIFPVLIALYLQFRHWKWGDWAGAFDVHLVAGLLIWAMVLLYAMGWLLIGLRTRLDTYVDLLENSLKD